MFTISQIHDHLIGMGHGGTLNKVRNIYAIHERVASLYLAKYKPLETVRDIALTSPVYDDVYNYTLPTDFNDLIDLIPQDNRTLWDNAFRNNAGTFDREKAARNKTVSIEGQNGRKIIRINWRTNSPKVLNTMNSYNGNGTWTGVGTASGIATDTIFKASGGGSVVFNHNASGDGIQNSTMTAIDLTNENGVSSAFFLAYFTTVPTSATLLWGNDLTANYWTAPSVTTQADGTSFQVGWNLLQFSWAAATQTGTVAPASIDSAKITFASSDALGKIRIDNITFGIGRNFDMKYYSKYLFQTTAGVWESRPTTDDDLVLVDNDSLGIYLFECLQAMAQQMEGTDGAFDINFANQQLMQLYPILKGRYPSMAKKQTASYGGPPRFGPISWRRWKR
jgi:hypothetical protein